VSHCDDHVLRLLLRRETQLHANLSPQWPCAVTRSTSISALSGLSNALATQVLTDATERSDADKLDASELLDATLRKMYECQRKLSH